LGLSHLDNLFLPRADELGVAYQILEAALVGILFAAVRLRMNTIWPVIAVHAGFNFSSSWRSGMPSPWRPHCPASSWPR